MKVGDLVRNIYTSEVYIITRVESTPIDQGDYYEVHSQWIVPEDHLELISESR